MSYADEAAAVVGPQAHLVGLWLANNHQRSISPLHGTLLVQLALECEEELKPETDPILVGDVSQFIRALKLVANVALVQNAVILDRVAKAFGTS